jgi:hypothetical protein
MESGGSHPVVDSQTSILVGSMVEVIFPDDDWTGLSNASARRRLQNRLNQRAYSQLSYLHLVKVKFACAKQLIPETTLFDTGKRRAQRPQSNGLGRHIQKAMHPAPKSQPQIQPKLVVCEDKDNQSHKAAEYVDSLTRACTRDLEPAFDMQTSNHNSTAGPAYDAENCYAMSSDHLIHLIQFNVYRALLSNVYTLGLTPEMMQMNIPSPFTTFGPVQMEYHLPPGLQPTRLQRSIPHHPYVDVLPVASFRDKLLLVDENFDDGGLRFHMASQWLPNSGAGRVAGGIVWGEPWDPFAWEFTEVFAKKWSWVLEGCSELVKTTNYWRAKRGEKELVIGVSSHESLRPNRHRSRT